MMMLLGVSTLVASLLDLKPYLHLQFVPHMTKYHQVGVILLVFILSCQANTAQSTGGF